MAILETSEAPPPVAGAGLLGTPFEEMATDVLSVTSALATGSATVLVLVEQA